MAYAKKGEKNIIRYMYMDTIHVYDTWTYMKKADIRWRRFMKYIS